MHKLISRIDRSGIQRLRELALEIWPRAFEKILSPRQIEYMLEMMYSENVLLKDFDRGVEFYILRVDDEDRGYAAIEKLDEKSYKLHKIYLSQQLHGKGIGKYLIAEIEKIVRNYGSDYLKLNVNRENTAVGFYKSCGYDIIDSEDIDIGNGYFMNDYVMQKKLDK